MIGIVSASYLAKELWLLNCRNWEPGFKIFNPGKKNVVIVEGSGEEFHGVSSRSLVARAVTVNSMDTEQGTVIPPNKEIQQISTEGTTTVSQTATPLSTENFPDLVGINHYLKISKDIPLDCQISILDTSLSTPNSLEAEILQIDA